MTTDTASNPWAPADSSTEDQPPASPLATPPTRSAAATWVAAVGAFLLFAAAVLFVAVRWDDLVPAAKLAAIVGATGAVITGGQALRRTLPAVGTVLFDLGVLLVPVDVLAVSRHLGAGWDTAIMVTGAIGTVATVAGWRVAGSTSLRRAALLGAVVTVGGFGATTATPALVLLAGLALAAAVVETATATGGGAMRDARELLGREAALAWASVVGLALVVIPSSSAGLVDGSAEHRLAVLGERLGLLAGPASASAALAGLTAAVAIGLVAAARRAPGLAVTATVVGLAGAARTWDAAEISDEVSFLTFAAVAFVIQVLASVNTSDPFWAPVTRRLGVATEWVCAPAVGAAGFAIVAVPIAVALDSSFGGSGDIDTEPVLAAAFALLGAMWMVADLRRRVSDDTSMGLAVLVGGGHGPATLAMSLSFGAAVALATASPEAITVAAFATSLLVLAGGRAWGRSTAAAALLVAPLGVADHLGALVGVLAASALVTAWSATLGVPARSTIDDSGDPAFGSRTGWWALSVLAGLEATWSLLAAVELAELGRTGQVVALLAAALVALGLTGVLTAEAADGDSAGPARLDALVPWARPLLATSVMQVLWALGISMEDPELFSATLVVVGLVGAAVAVLVERPWLLHLSLALVTLGGWVHLGERAVDEVTPYALPVAVQLLAAGIWSRHDAERRGEGRVSSWGAHAPAVSVLGVAALVDRVDDGSGWFAVVAGLVAVVAVAVGGQRRLIGPLVTGTVLAVAVVAHESVAVAATVPTWVWLAAAGSALIGVAVVLERTDTSPVEAGRRLVDVIGERFD